MKVTGALFIWQGDDGLINFSCVKRMNFPQWKRIQSKEVVMRDARVKVVKDSLSIRMSDSEWIQTYLEGKASGQLSTYRLD